MEIQLSEEEMSGFCAIDVDDNASCLKSLRKELEETEKKRRGADQRTTIFRVPDSIREADPKAYQPKIISFGPYHHGNAHLQEMEQLKRLYMKSLLTQYPNAGLADYYREMKGLEQRARSSYSEEIPMKSEEFIKMLMLDGCFIIQLLLTLSRRRKQAAVPPIGPETSALEGEQQQLLTQRKEEEEEDDDDDDDDPVIDKPWALALVGTDMLRLENQLPFFVLQSLLCLATAAAAADGTEGKAMIKASLPDLALDFFYDLLPSNERSTEEAESPPQFGHLLHLFHWGIEPSDPRPPRAVNCCSCRRPSTHSIDPESVPCATELKDAGVNFKKNEGVNSSLLDVDFHYSCLILGVLKFTTLPIYDQTGDIFRNFIALEQCSPGVGSYVTTYAVLMDCIVDTPADVALLHREGVVVNGLGSDEDAAAMFNGLCRGVVFDLERSYLSGLFRDVTTHCESRANRWRATLVRDYFSSPWSLLSLVGALIILSLTVVQTAFAIRSYFQPPS